MTLINKFFQVTIFSWMLHMKKCVIYTYFWIHVYHFVKQGFAKSLIISFSLRLRTFSIIKGFALSMTDINSVKPIERVVVNCLLGIFMVYIFPEESIPPRYNYYTRFSKLCSVNVTHISWTLDNSMCRLLVASTNW